MTARYVLIGSHVGASSSGKIDAAERAAERHRFARGGIIAECTSISRLMRYRDQRRDINWLGHGEYEHSL